LFHGRHHLQLSFILSCFLYVVLALISRPTRIVPSFVSSVKSLKKSNACRVAFHPCKEESGNNVVTVVEVKKDIITIENMTDRIERDAGVLSPQQLSRGQRKCHAKREQFLRKEKLIFSSLQLKEDTEQGRCIDGVDAIKNALMGTCEEARKGVTSEGRDTPRITNKRAKKSIVENEVERMNLVLQHPAYQNDAWRLFKSTNRILCE
jgi:hypothetical protein